MDDARLFLCARCRRQVLICSVCDRGQQYCNVRCSGLARDESLRAAGRRYQQSRRGRHCHAERQRRYRRRRREGACREIVTHQGSASSRRGAPLVRQRVLRREASPSMSPKPATKRARATSGTSKMHCHFRLGGLPPYLSPVREARAWRCSNFRLLRKLAWQRQGEHESGRAVVLDSTSSTLAAFNAADAVRAASAAASR